MDCLIRVKIEYPAETMRWLMNPTATITITSQRNEDDPLHFTAINLRTFMLPYDKYEQNGVFRRAFEEILRNVMLLVAIAFILSQLFYAKKDMDAIPYISLVMLTLQTLGYSLPLISDSKILFPPKEYRNAIHNLYGYEEVLEVLDYSGKLLVLAALLLTARIFQKVSESRSRPINHSITKFPPVPCDKPVLLITMAIYIFGCFSFLLVQGKLFEPERDKHKVGDIHMEGIWMNTLKECIDVSQNFFLLPQIIGNLLWQTHTKPLTKSYYIGFTLATGWPVDLSHAQTYLMAGNGHATDQAGSLHFPVVRLWTVHRVGRSRADLGPWPAHGMSGTPGCGFGT
ncbi:unnamed protein product [Ilex paraguariensis]|uniref:RING-type E3 ubiquitin transferase n=1 Tax=Ilex paraguariensis TaxID=185542 RepID=A0ABC8SIM8_9AQUA